MPSIIESLVLEHAYFCAVFDQIHKALPVLTLHDLKKLARLLERSLLHHAAAEEDLVLLAVEQGPAEKRHAVRFYKEHQEIDSQLTRVHDTDAVDEARSYLRCVISHTRSHFRHEERIVFPMIERLMDADTRHRLGKVWHLRRTASHGFQSKRLEDTNSFRNFDLQKFLKSEPMSRGLITNVSLQTPAPAKRVRGVA